MQTKKQIRTAVHFLSKDHAIGTTKGTHGLLITILNYNFYQTMSNYEGHAERHSEGKPKGTILRKKDKERKKTPSFFLDDLKTSL